LFSKVVSVHSSDRMADGPSLTEARPPTFCRLQLQSLYVPRHVALMPVANLPLASARYGFGQAWSCFFWSQQEKK